MNETLNVICDRYCKYPTMIDSDLDQICRECPLTNLPMKAEEGRMFLSQDAKTCVWKDAEDLRNFDKQIFIENTGWLLSQTREGVDSIRMKDENTAEIIYENGYTRDVDVEMCSFLAIVKTICKNV